MKQITLWEIRWWGHAGAATTRMSAMVKTTRKDADAFVEKMENEDEDVVMPGSIELAKVVFTGETMRQVAAVAVAWGGGLAGEDEYVDHEEPAGADRQVVREATD